MVHFKEDRLVLEIATTEPLTVYFRILESLATASCLLAEINDGDLATKAIEDLNFLLSLNFLDLPPDQLKQMEIALFS